MRIENDHFIRFSLFTSNFLNEANRSNDSQLSFNETNTDPKIKYAIEVGETEKKIQINIL